MKVYKNLMGDNSKIHVDEIGVSPNLLLSDSVLVEWGAIGNGSYYMYGDGRMYQYGFISWNRDTTRDKFFSFPKAFRNNIIMMTLNADSSTSSGSGWNAIWDGNMNLAVGSDGSNRFRVYRTDTKYREGGTLHLRWSAWGRWK